jgi:hypothetical protein
MYDPMINNIITLGCSLTHHHGWAEYVSQSLKLPLTNLSISGSSNQIQMRRIQEYIFANTITDNDLIIWQVTGTVRRHKREKMTTELAQEIEKQITRTAQDTKFSPTMKESPFANIFDQTPRVDFLCQNEDAPPMQDEEQLLEDLLFYILAIKKYTPNLIIFFGWNKSLPYEHFPKFKNILKDNNILVIDEAITDWCLERKLNFEPCLHPSIGSSYRYAKENILPAIEKMFDIEIEPVQIWAK